MTGRETFQPPTITRRASRYGSSPTASPRSPAARSWNGASTPDGPADRRGAPAAVNEPRGHADMYGCFLSRPTTREPTSACCSGTRTGTPPRAATAPSRSGSTRSERAGGGRPRRGDRRRRRRTVRQGDGTVRCAGGAVRGSLRERSLPTYSRRGITVPDTRRGPVAGGRRPTAAPSTPPSRPSASGCRVAPAHFTDLLALGRAITRKLERDPPPGTRATPARGIYGTILHENSTVNDPTPTSATSPSSPTARWTARRAAPGLPPGWRC